MKPFIIAAAVAAILAPCAQANAQNAHHIKPSLYEQIANRCMYIAATSTDNKAPEIDVMQAATLCIKGAEYVIAQSEVSDVYQRETLAADVEQATTQEDADHAQLFLNAYDAGRLIGRGYADTYAKGGK